MTILITATVVRMFAIGLLIFYVLKRKYKDDRKRKFGFWDGFWNYLDKRTVELILFAVIIPDWKLILELIK